MLKKILLTFIALLATVSTLGGQAFAQNPVKIHVAIGYNKGNDRYNIVVEERADTKLELYVNDQNPTETTANKENWATFLGVKLVDSGKISFTKVLEGGNHKSYQKPINYTRHFVISDGKVMFSDNDSPATAADLATPTTSDAVLTPVSEPVPSTASTPRPSVPSDSGSTANTYTNVDGRQIESPSSDTTGATGVCNDGTYTHATHHQGACSGHGGVKQWL